MVGNDLDAVDRPEVERHLAQCTPCHDYHSGMVRLRSELEAAGADPGETSDSLWPVIRPAVCLESSNRSARRFNGWIAGLAVAASVMAVITISNDFVPASFNAPRSEMEAWSVGGPGSGPVRQPEDKVWQDRPSSPLEIFNLKQGEDESKPAE